MAKKDNDILLTVKANFIPDAESMLNSIKKPVDGEDSYIEQNKVQGIVVEFSPIDKITNANVVVYGSRIPKEDLNFVSRSGESLSIMTVIDGNRNNEQEIQDLIKDLENEIKKVIQEEREALLFALTDMLTLQKGMTFKAKKINADLLND